MKRAWLSLWFLGLGWDALAPHVESVSPRLAIGAILAGLILLGARRTGPSPLGRPAAAWLVIGSAAAALLLPWPHGIGLALLAVGGLAVLVPGLSAGARGNAWRVPLAGGALLLLHAVLAPLWSLAEASWHHVGATAGPFAFLLRVLGVQAAADPPFVYWQGVGQVVTIDCSLERLIGHAAALFFASGFVLAAATAPAGERGRRLLRLTAVAIAWAVVRNVAMVLQLDGNPDPSRFWERTWGFGTLLPAASVLAAAVPLRRPRPATAADPGESFRPALLVTAAVAGILAAVAFGFHDPGKPKTGRVVVDEHHSNWEWSTIELNTESYGTQTVYNYSELVRYLGHFYEVDRNFEPITDDVLGDVSVLILKTPTTPYEPSEVAAIERFVDRGGGVWLIGDHTNVFGMSTNLNAVGRRFGMTYRYDAVIDLRTNGRQLYRRPRVFAHPVVRHLPPLHMATSCSMVGPLTGRRVMLGRSLLSDRLDYSVNAFFGDFRSDASESFGSMLQSVAVERGRGRVLGFSDSTIFSNFFMFIRGKPELALGSVAWLARENRFPGARSFLLVAAGLGLAGLAVAFGRRPSFAAGAVAVAVAIPAFALSARALDAWTSGFSRFPEPREPLPLVAFERGRSDFHIPDFSEIPERSPRSFHTFYVWTQRVGCIPMTHLFDRCLERADAMVFLNPRLGFSPEEVARFKEWVGSGGRALVLDSPHARHTSAGDLLGPFGLRFEGAEMETVLVREPAGQDSVAVLAHIRPVTGGEPLLVLPDDTAAAAVVRHGRGRVVAMCASDNFSDAVLGTTSEVPTTEQLALYRLEFRMFDEWLGPDQPPAASGAPPGTPEG